MISSPVLFVGEAYPLPTDKTPVVLIVGQGAPAAETAAVIASTGGRPVVLNPWGEGVDGVKVITGRLTDLWGPPGYFKAVIDTGSGLKSLGVSGVVLAAEPMIDPAGQGCNLADSQAMEQMAAHAGGRTVVLLSGYWSCADPRQFQELIGLAGQLARDGDKVFVFSPQAKVALEEVEAEYRRARQDGVIFTRLLQPPQVTPADKGWRVEYDDPIICDRVGLTAQVVAYDPPLRPDQTVAETAQAMGLQLGPDGWPAPDNLLFPPPLTSRAGVWAVGGARGPDRYALMDDLELLDQALREHLAPASGPPAVRLASDRQECAVCLTCYRACPVGAIGWDLGPVVALDACLQCGQCAAVCPAGIIKPTWEREGELTGLLARPGQGQLVLACQRIPEEALEQLPSEITTHRLSCAGRVSEEVLLKLASAGWDKILVAACHHDNCRSLSGSRRAEKMVGLAREMLTQLDLDPDRLRFLTVAPNQAGRLLRAVEGS